MRWCIVIAPGVRIAGVHTVSIDLFRAQASECNLSLMPILILILIDARFKMQGKGMAAWHENHEIHGARGINKWTRDHWHSHIVTCFLMLIACTILYMWAGVGINANTLEQAVLLKPLCSRLSQPGSHKISSIESPRPSMPFWDFMQPHWGRSLVTGMACWFPRARL